MSQMLFKHAVLLGFAIPMSFVGYHALYGMGDGDGDAEAATRTLVDAVGGFALGSTYDLSDLEVLQHDLLYVEQRYVERERVDP